jgi:uncharacterized protein YdaU (DUF1376 family)
MEWYPRYPSLWRAKTMHLNPFQEGCYLRLIDEYMETRQPLQDNDGALARIIGISVDEWLRDASGIVRAFFTPRKGLLFQDRCDIVLREQDERSRKQSEKSKKGAEARWHKTNGIDAAGITKAMPKNATGQDRTRQEKEIPPLFPHINGANHAKRRKPTTFITENFRGDIGCVALAGELRLDFDTEQRRFIDHYLAKGEARADWQASLRTWLGNASRFRAERAERKSSGRSGVRDVTGAALRVAANLQKDR